MNKLILSISLLTIASVGTSNFAQDVPIRLVEPQAAWIPVKQNFSLRCLINNSDEEWSLIDSDGCEFVEYKLNQRNHGYEGRVFEQKWKLKAPALGFYNITFQRGDEIQVSSVYVSSITEGSKVVYLAWRNNSPYFEESFSDFSIETMDAPLFN
jgi:hypothetical protein